MGVFKATKAGVGHMIAPMNLPGIRAQGREIAAIAERLRNPPQVDGGFVIGADHKIDYEASVVRIRARAQAALDAGNPDVAELTTMAEVSPQELRLIRQYAVHHSARKVWMYLGVCAAFTLVWLGLVAAGSSGYTGWLYIAEWTLIVLCLAVLALKAAWSNWCLRTDRIAPFSAFLTTSDSWLPP